MRVKMSQISWDVCVSRWRAPWRAASPGRVRSSASALVVAGAISSCALRSAKPASTRWRRAFICLPTSRFRSGAAGWSQLFLTWVSRPCLRLCQRSRNFFQEVISVAAGSSAPKVSRSAAKSGATASGEWTPRAPSCLRVFSAMSVMASRSGSLHERGRREKPAAEAGAPLTPSAGCAAGDGRQECPPHYFC